MTNILRSRGMPLVGIGIDDWIISGIELVVVVVVVVDVVVRVVWCRSCGTCWEEEAPPGGLSIMSVTFCLLSSLVHDNGHDD